LVRISTGHVGEIDDAVDTEYKTDPKSGEVEIYIISGYPFVDKFPHESYVKST
jgi:hypothetical protein